MLVLQVSVVTVLSFLLNAVIGCGSVIKAKQFHAGSPCSISNRCQYEEQFSKICFKKCLPCDIIFSMDFTASFAKCVCVNCLPTDGEEACCEY